MNNKMFRGLEITLTNSETKDIIKVFRSLESRGILSKGTTRNIISEEGGFLNFLKLLMAAGLSLSKFVLLAKSFLVPIELAATASAKVSVIQKDIFGVRTTALIISNEEMQYIMKTVQSLKDSGIMMKGVTEIIKNEAKEQKGGFVGM